MNNIKGVSSHSHGTSILAKIIQSQQNGLHQEI